MTIRLKIKIPTICFLIGLAAICAPASASGTGGGMVPTPDCIQTILNEDVAVPNVDCLAQISAIDTTDGTNHSGAAYPVARVESEKYSMIIHYTGGSFPDARTANWPLSIDLNFGGSGWFSYLLVLVETGDGEIASGFVEPAGDRCNDGYARWERFSENGNGIYRRAATPFRLVNPLDETNWRAVENAMLFEGKDENAQKAEMLKIANPPLYREWLPYREVENCASCCVGEIVIMQNMIGSEVDSGRDYGVLGVVLNRQAIARLADSERIGDRCLATSLNAAAAKAEPDGPEGTGLFLYRDSWLEIRDELAETCSD